MHRRTAYFSGNVQGVGFRYTTQNLAIQFDVNGYVRNLPDGRVELVIEGDDREMDHLVQAIRQRMEGFIKRVDLQESPATNQFERFSIRH
jgi:acylphosphatase